MVTVTANDIRVLARSREVDPVLAVVDGEIAVIPHAALKAGDTALCSQQKLVGELGDEITDIEAQLFAGRLANLLPE
ncbi:hypothetical protein QEZ54_09260 [Catellatospora sp. KI3]|uniref:hypothetical protein n=1 Tax=Catellatospora sp. KI3 TaxID=3041620 RepID=UPI00248249A5|nr:hypothetical protein [Catellatospora sp. KI3]MDI1461152.1 hypothetical protein [Catellatospora sp. KI3]